MSTSLAWEVTREDVDLVLGKHGVPFSEKALSVVQMKEKRVVDMVLFSTDFYEQVDIALEEIERILMEEGILSQRTPFWGVEAKA